MKPRLLDLFCCAGGGAMGYNRAGFEVVGVDIEPQPNYPFEFHQADAMTFPLDGFDMIHASPPCQDHSTLGHEKRGTGWMLGATIERLKAHGHPWVVENVVGGSVRMDGWWFTLCGSMFPTTLQIRRHRRFGSSHLLLAPSCRHSNERPFTVTGHGSGVEWESKHSRQPSIEQGKELMGMPWATWEEVTQAIPPAYTEWIGSHMLERL